MPPPWLMASLLAGQVSETGSPGFGAVYHRHCRAPVSGSRESRYPGTSVTSPDRKSTRLNSSHQIISYAVFCLKKKTTKAITPGDYKTLTITEADSSTALKR